MCEDSVCIDPSALIICSKEQVILKACKCGSTELMCEKGKVCKDDKCIAQSK